MFVGVWGFGMIIPQLIYPMTILEQILDVSGYHRPAAPHVRGARVRQRGANGYPSLLRCAPNRPFRCPPSYLRFA
jgi:hypothetical protein